jgi:hypothetical protein
MASLPAPSTPLPTPADRIAQAHQLYCQLTGQTLRLGFDRERQWYELLHGGYTLADLRTVIAYLQREIRADRRNVGALKLSNLLQPDRFEEDLQISRVCLRPPRPSPPRSPLPPSPSADQQEHLRQQALACVRQIKATLRTPPTHSLTSPPSR